ncbi:HAD family hydrolase [Paenibacillus mucilaginosus]|uniref:Haloacid dehalogenase domain-containing protein hydrolase n=1 Tax=Paenibacillus mucilaginosus (strain KNP414) TaxID=1036673 RepID=F8FHB4_PAEMK|nr:HAD family hydrolase [Paenibacillus mucilaginosus]AEI39816.1 haloacid dehalogenase domain-containing protein hydrolase [Paenibacillus mucilaginosus KNP414]MCG7217875.1 HAD hydrolase-like protein [Paenibacillus mucilaginosus]WDM29097.1 HAD hydrolase-like protein [Paenibacillus mucilaginosus]
MTARTMPEAMIFDVDGTLFQTETLLLPAYHATFDRLRSEGLYVGETPPEQYILGSLGMLLEHIWQQVIPESDVAVHRRADELLLHYQVEGMARGEGLLYEGVAETLKELRARGIRLFTASNGLEGYVKGVIRAQGLEPLFESGGLFSAGEHSTRSKVDLVRKLLDQYGIRSAWMVGDRSSDVEAGHANGLFVVGCDYAGFRKEGELDEADVRIRDFREIVGLLPER